MKKEIKILGLFIKTSILIIIVASVFLVTGISYGAVNYSKINKLTKEAESLMANEEYDSAVEKLEIVQNKWIVKNLGLMKKQTEKMITDNKILAEDKLKYNQGVNAIDNLNYQEAISLLSELPETSFYYQKAQTKIEEAKRKTLEGELSEEQLARKEAESKAKQEEFEKKLKEQQLISKETEEKMMNADNDGDGLTYRRESELKTSDWDTDSDNDGIRDNLDTHPAGGGRNIAQTFAWSYAGYSWTWTENIQEDWYDYYKAKSPRPEPLSVEYITYNDPFIQKISKIISEAAEEKNISKGALAKAFVQSLSYINDVYTGYDEYPKYPIETFFEKNGDCEDTSYLAASITQAMNIDTVLVALPGHMAIAVWMDCDVPGTSYKLNDRCYYYTETTGEGWISGEIPDRYKNYSAILIKIPSGETVNNINPHYKKPCDPSIDFTGYYYDGKNFYSDSQCNNPTSCLPYKEFYYNPSTQSFYHDGGCSQIVVKGCYKSKSYPGYFYISGVSWYYDSKCTQLYKSMNCDYPSILSYSCTSEYSYSSKQSTCVFYTRIGYSQETIDNCYQELARCRNDINEYQSKLNEYNSCWDKKEY